MDGALNRAILNDQQHLARQIDLERASQPQPGLRRLGMPKRPPGLRPDDAIALDLLPALKSNDGIPGLHAEDAVDTAALQVAERDEPPL
jgi:hypothetical protein